MNFTNPNPEGASGRPWKAIAAMSENRVIGKDNRLPWNLPEELEWVRQCTKGQIIAMGRRTFEAMGRPLPGRENIVISRTVREIEGCVVLPSLEALETYETDRDVWIFGGAQIYARAFDRIGELYLTIVKGTFEGDTFFPPFEDQFHLDAVIRETPEFTIYKYIHND